MKESKLINELSQIILLKLKGTIESLASQADTRI